jgi:hypothetical protein
MSRMRLQTQAWCIWVKRGYVTKGWLEMEYTDHWKQGRAVGHWRYQKLKDKFLQSFILVLDNRFHYTKARPALPVI